MADDLRREADQAFHLKSSNNAAPGTTSMERPGPTLDHVSSASIKSGIAGYDVSRPSDNLGADSSQPQQSTAGSGLTGSDPSNTFGYVIAKLSLRIGIDPKTDLRIEERLEDHHGPVTSMADTVTNMSP